MGKKRMGRPPAGPGGSKVQDLPRVTIRLEPEIRRRALAYAKETGRPLWRLIQDLLRTHLDGEPSTPRPVAPPSEEPPAKLAAAADVAGQVEPGTLRTLELTYADARLFFGALYWRRSLAPDPGATAEHRQALEALAALFAERKPPRGGSVEDTWSAELSLDQCRRLRQVLREYLGASDERLELEMHNLRAEWRPDAGLPPAEEPQHRKRIRAEIRAVNGPTRRALKRVPWR